jgi:hypothetical protein
MSTILAGIGLVFFTFGIPYLVSQPARTRRQRAALMFFGAGAVVFFVIAVGALLPSRFADRGLGFWVLEALILPLGIAMSTLPFVFLRFANRVDRRRYGHIVECHPLLARLVWERELGPKPLGGIYGRRCPRWFCLSR